MSVSQADSPKETRTRKGLRIACHLFGLLGVSLFGIFILLMPAIDDQSIAFGVLILGTMVFSVITLVGSVILALCRRESDYPQKTEA
jgi:hypothetical protein